METLGLFCFKTVRFAHTGRRPLTRRREDAKEGTKILVGGDLKVIPSTWYDGQKVLAITLNCRVKKAPILITFGVIALALGITFLSRQRKKVEIDYWQLVPASAVGVMETRKPATFQKLGVDSTGLIKVIAAIGSVAPLEPHLFCFQSTGKQIDWLVLLPRGFPSPLDTLGSLKKALTKRTYEGKTLYDFREGSVAWATLVNIEGIWAVSPSSLLVEEIVRQSRREASDFRKANSQLFTLATVKQDDGNLYLNLSKTSGGNGRRTVANEYMQRFSHSLVLDLKWNDQNLQGNGFAADTAAFSTVLSCFTDQKPVTFELRKRIPDQFASAIHFGFSDPELWFVNRDKVYSAIAGGDASSASTDTVTGFNRSEFAKAVDDEVMYCKLADGGEVIIFELKEITRAQAQMDKIRRSVETERENYADRAIHTLKKENVLASLVWPLKLQAYDAVYTFDGNLMLVSGEKESIKQFLDFTDRDQVLGKSIAWSKFLETTLGESNVDFLFNSSIDPQFANGLGLPRVAPVEKASLQFYALKGNYFSSASIQFAGRGPAPTSAARPDMLTVKFADRVLHSPWLVRNHQERQNEVMVQDAAFHLRFMDGEGRVRWTKDLKAAITTGIEEMDYLKNGKIQYLFCTTGELHLLDRLGNYVKGFPRKIDIMAPQWLSVVDYDGSRDYRIVIADNDGKIFIFDKNGKALDGWNPKSLGQSFADAPTHYRINGKDYYVALTTRGEMHLFARRGDLVSPFPLRMGSIPCGDVACDGELISTVSTSGMLTKVSVKGKKELEEPLLKNIADAKFCLVASADRKDFIVTRAERGNLAVFDSEGKQKFEIVNPLSDNVEVQYHKSKLVVVRDREQGLLYVVDITGKSLTAQPLQASHAPAVDVDGKGIATLFICSGDNLTVLKLRLR
jgi:hypothetical protein